jgi:adenosylcobinamide kinase/adenosylcobinamide-phosphate guanylyltransferase
VRDIVIVSDYIYSDAILYDELTDAYRRGLAYIDRTLAAVCDVVLEVAFGSITLHKGGEVFSALYEKVL